MDTGMEIFIFLAYAMGMGIVLLLAKVFTFSVHMFFKIVVNSFCGVIILMAINVIGLGMGIHIPINLITGFGVGTLGIPGIVLLYLCCT